MAGLSPGMPSSYSPSPNRPEFTAGHPSYQVPRGEIMTVARPPPPQPGYQLPPIRSQQQAVQPSGESGSWPRDDKSRVDIGGLIDKPDSSSKPSQ